MLIQILFLRLLVNKLSTLYRKTLGNGFIMSSLLLLQMCSGMWSRKVREFGTGSYWGWGWRLVLYFYFFATGGGVFPSCWKGMKTDCG